MSEPRVSLIVPILDAAEHLPSVLPPLERALACGDLHELWMVDDGSRDGSVALCRNRGLEVLLPAKASETPRGPAHARNRGAARATGELLMFVDADVVIPPDLPRRMRQVLVENPDAVAVFGSYDDQPVAPGRLSRCRNLLHHWMHQHGDPEARTFWAALGMVRREDFRAVDGFDALRFPVPSIEDIELGTRLLARGRILLRPDLQGTHRKRWTWATMIATDLLRRARPWARLNRERPEADRSLNVSPAERVRALLSNGCLVALFGLPVWPAEAAPLSLVLLLACAWTDRAFLGLVARRLGPGSVLVGFAMLRVYYAAAVLGWGLAKVGRRNLVAPSSDAPRLS